MGWYTLTALSTMLIVATVEIVRQIIRNRIEGKGLPLPSGPIPLPLLGSALSVNAKAPWLTYTEWRKKYGDILFVRLLDTDIVILSSASVATELLEKRSKIYSDRPSIPTAAPYGHDYNFGLAPYGDRWRLCRRIFQQTFRANAALAFRPMQLSRARQLVSNIIGDLNEYPFHFSTFAVAVTLSAVYDYEPRPQNDPMVSIMDKYLEAAVPGLSPGKVVLLKIFPFLLHIPHWLPGSWISREAKEANAWRDKVVETPYKHVQQRIESKDHVNTSMVSDHITRMEKFSGPYRSEYETAVKHASATAFISAAETTSSILLTFTLAMVENPHVWKRAQAEIDTVVGIGRVPEFDDRPSLTYVEAILRESMRWRPVTPTNIPHATVCSDVYNGYYIPKGATVLVNAWAISRDEARYPNAEKFMPERFLDAQGRLTDDNPREFIFGFGRRKCPGQYTADASLWSAIVTMLATIDFNLAKDADGRDITFTATFTSGLSDHPNPFPCGLAPRPHVSKEWIASILSK